MADKKKCPRCHSVKDIEQFRDETGKVRFLCNPCREHANKYDRQRYANGLGKTYSKQKAYRQELLAQPVPDGQQRCSQCLIPKLAKEFIAPELGCGKSTKCRACRDYLRDYMAKQRAEQPERYRLEIAKALERNRRQKLICLRHYGHRCACCGVENYEFLTFDHVNDDGARHRAEIGADAICRWLIKNKFPNTVQVLCWNCQWGKRMGNGVCPHQVQRAAEALARETANHYVFTSDFEPSVTMAIRPIN